MSILLETTNDLMTKIDQLPCHPKYKLSLYHRFILSKIAWHLTSADLSKTWVVEHLDTIVANFVRHLLEVPISATLSHLIISKSHYGLHLILPSTKFSQCQTTIRNALKSSPNPDIRYLWQDSSQNTNIQYDQYKNAKHVLKAVQQQHQGRLEYEVTSQGFIISSSIKFASPKVTSLWSTVQQSMPKNIFYFSLKYLTNTLATRKNLFKWYIGQSSACSFCLQSETLQHVVSSCKSYLDQGRYTWRHDSVLTFIANTLSALPSCSIYADLPALLSPSLVTGDSLRPDLLLITKNNTLHILELTIGFETNIKVNSDRKALKYNPLHQDLR